MRPQNEVWIQFFSRILFSSFLEENFFLLFWKLILSEKNIHKKSLHICSIAVKISNENVM